MNVLLVLTAIATIGGLTFLLASLLVLANSRLQVAEDPRIDAVEDMLPRTNCGGCGYPGCRPFAEALVDGAALPGTCTVGSPEAQTRIADYLGVDVGAQARRVARLACAGGTNVARTHAQYTGLSSCRAATLVAGGGKGCFWGCLGHGDCEVACGFDAIRMNEHHLPVVDESLCTACGDCVTECPKDLFSLQRVDDRLFVACRSAATGDGVLEDCEVGCTACGKCAMDAPAYITMEGSLPVVRHTGQTTRAPIERCPTGAIVWFDAKSGPVKGEAARKIIRKGALKDAPT